MMINNTPILKIYKKRNSSSELTSQMLYGEKFEVIKKYKKWLKIKTSYDGYVGFVNNKKYLPNKVNTHKIVKLKSNVYSKKNKKFKITNIKLPFNSRLKVLSKNKNFLEFSQNKWVDKKDVKEINHKEKKFNKIFKIFLNTRYLWGGKSYRGIDCSALIQSFYYYNNKYCPRDSYDQINFFKKILNARFNKAGLLIFWKGHVACILTKKKLIHAYGPRKKVLTMNTHNTIEEIKKKSNLRVKGIRNLYAIG